MTTCLKKVIVLCLFVSLKILSCLCLDKTFCVVKCFTRLWTRVLTISWFYLPEWMKLDMHCPERFPFLQAWLILTGWSLWSVWWLCISSSFAMIFIIPEIFQLGLIDISRDNLISHDYSKFLGWYVELISDHPCTCAEI